MRIEERKQVQTKDGLTVTSYELLVIAECHADFEMLDRIGKPGTTFTGEVHYSALMIRPQGSSSHPIGHTKGTVSEAWSAVPVIDTSERARDAAQPVETAGESAKTSTCAICNKPPSGHPLSHSYIPRPVDQFLEG